jgi:5-formyltetrahydrofolate cyclo-ligase
MDTFIGNNITHKHALRTAALARRAAITEEEQAHHAAAFSSHFLRVINAASKTVAGYWAHKHEIDVTPLLQYLRDEGEIVCLPVTASDSRQLIFRRWHADTIMITSAFGIPVPAPESASENTAIIPDIVIAPLVAFDAARHRIGYGAGYYDHTLQALRQNGHKPIIIGAAHSIQQVECIPAESHDVALDMIITEKGVLGVDF